MPKADKSVTESAPKRSPSWLIAPLSLLLLLVVVATTAVLFIVENQDTADECVVLSSQQAPEEVCVDLDVVASQAELSRGLSGREGLSMNEGMLFDFGVSGQHCMWMPDMNFSIDIIWIDGAGQVVDIAQNVSPDTYPETFCNDSAPARYVIELKAGLVDIAEVVRGQKIQL